MVRLGCLQRERVALVCCVALSVAIMGGTGAGSDAIRSHDAYPSRPLTIIVPYAKGGGLDLTCRLLAKYMTPMIRQPITVENITDGSNLHAYEVAGAAAPDGYTISAWSNGLVTDELLIKNLPYRRKDFKPVAMMSTDPHLLVVQAAWAREAGINGVEDLFEYARSHPGMVRIGVGGNWSTHDFIRLKIERAGKVKLNRIPYLGGAPALRAAAEGACHIATPFVSEYLALEDRDAVIPLAVAHHERAALLPAVPSVPELGYPGMTQSIWRILALPQDTPEPVLRSLERAVRDAMAAPGFVHEARAAGIHPRFIGADALQAFVEKEFRFYKRKLKEWGLGFQFQSDGEVREGRALLQRATRLR